ncbi:MAG: hypothetical protein AAB393_00825 [Bacteroidota bacterium]
MLTFLCLVSGVMGFPAGCVHPKDGKGSVDLEPDRYMAELLVQHARRVSDLEEVGVPEIRRKELAEELVAIEHVILQCGGTVPARNYRSFARERAATGEDVPGQQQHR